MNERLWKHALQRAMVGAPVGLMISTFITIMISITVGDGKYYAVVPELASDAGSEIFAVTIQALCSLLYGAAFAGASVIWDTDWSLTKMTGLHLLICSAATFPIAYLMRWMEHSPAGVLKYFGLFFCIYAGIWIAQYIRIKKNVNALNRKVRDFEST